MKRRKILWQVYPALLLITLLALLAVTWLSTASLRRFYHEQTAVDLEARARLVAGHILAVIDSPDGSAVDSLCKVLGETTHTRFTMILPSGKVIGDTDEDPAEMDNHADRPEVRTAMKGGVGISSRFSHTLGRNMMYVGIPLYDRGWTRGVLRSSVPLATLGHALGSAYWQIVAGGLIIAGLVTIGCLIVSRRISRPLENLCRGMEYFAGGDSSYRLPIPNSAELGSLAETFNQIASRLDDRVMTITSQRNEREAILSSMTEGVLAVDRDEKIIVVNNTAVRMLGLRGADVKGRNIQEVLRHPQMLDFMARVQTASEPVEEEFALQVEGDRFLGATGAPLRDAENLQIGAVIVLNDLTRIRRLETLRKEFVANVSHELKTPITAVKGFVETLRDGALNNKEDAERFLGIIVRQVDRLNSIIEDLLFLSRLEQDVEQADITLEREKLHTILGAAVEVCTARAEQKKIPLKLSCPEDLTAEVNSHLLEQAVVNLIDNAVKYSEPQNPVEIEALQTSTEILICVRDRGCGIPDEHLTRLFERFYRVDRARSRKLGGTGLGLAIVKHIAQAHGGTVSVDSIEGQGSTFCIHLPRS